MTTLVIHTEAVHSSTHRVDGDRFVAFLWLAGELFMVPYDDPLKPVWKTKCSNRPKESHVVGSFVCVISDASIACYLLADGTSAGNFDIAKHINTITPTSTALVFFEIEDHYALNAGFFKLAMLCFDNNKSRPELWRSDEWQTYKSFSPRAQLTDAGNVVIINTTPTDCLYFHIASRTLSTYQQVIPTYLLGQDRQVQHMFIHDAGYYIIGGAIFRDAKVVWHDPKFVFGRMGNHQNPDLMILIGSMSLKKMALVFTLNAEQPPTLVQSVEFPEWMSSVISRRNDVVYISRNSREVRAIGAHGDRLLMTSEVLPNRLFSTSDDIYIGVEFSISLQLCNA